MVCNDLADAHSTVAEIIANGGQAVAVEGNIGDMAVGAALTDAAVDSFGDLHVLVNNAGIIRDAMIWNMTERDFDAVVNVHLKGTFSATQAAARYWRARSKEGVTADRSIVNTSSGSGLHGNFGQWNYSACKAGLAIQVVNASRELGKFGVRANAIAPVARTAPVAATPGISELVGEPVDEDVFDRYNPKNISRWSPTWPPSPVTSPVRPSASTADTSGCTPATRSRTKSARTGSGMSTNSRRSWVRTRSPGPSKPVARESLRCKEQPNELRIPARLQQGP